MPLCYTHHMNPSDDDTRQDDISSDLFPNAGQRLSSHNFYSSEPTNSTSQSDYDESDTSEPEDFCPRCDAPLEIREGALGKYIACTRFPDCKFTEPYDDFSTAAPQKQDYDDEDDVIEKDYLKEAADELSGDRYTDEPVTAPDDNTGELNPYSPLRHDSNEPRESETTSIVNESTDYDQPSQSYSQPKQAEELSTEELYEEPYTEPVLSEEQPTEERPEQILEQQETKETIPAQEEKIVQPKPQGHRAFLPNHPIWLKTKAVTDGSNWVEMKQKRQMAQKAAGFSPAKPAAPGIVMPSPDELAETLKKLEANVQKLQQDEEQLVPPIAQNQPSSAPDEYDDDILPESIRQALSKKSED